MNDWRNETTLDMQELSVRRVNQTLRSNGKQAVRILHPQGVHSLACGLNAPLDVTVEGHAGYYCASMNQHANITVDGNAGTGLAENIMSGSVRVLGNASQSVGASGHGGLVMVKGNASARCGISMKGVDIIIGGNVGHMAAFMAQSGNLIVCGDAGADLGDSIYEAHLFVRGDVESLGADCIEKEMRNEHIESLQALLTRAGMSPEIKAESFHRYGSARKLYNFIIDNAGSA